MKTYGRHLLIEFFECNKETLGNPDALEEILTRAAIAAGATVVASAFHKFQPKGASGVLVLSESHISIHTWPDEGYASVDFYTCGTCDPHLGRPILSKGLESTKYEMMFIERGREGTRTSMALTDHCKDTCDEHI